jgi:hypothetical protein
MIIKSKRSSQSRFARAWKMDAEKGDEGGMK